MGTTSERIPDPTHLDENGTHGPPVQWMGGWGKARLRPSRAAAIHGPELGVVGRVLANLQHYLSGCDQHFGPGCCREIYCGLFGLNIPATSADNG